MCQEINSRAQYSFVTDDAGSKRSGNLLLVCTYAHITTRPAAVALAPHEEIFQKSFWFFGLFQSSLLFFFKHFYLTAFSSSPAAPTQTSAPLI